MHKTIERIIWNKWTRNTVLCMLKLLPLRANNVMCVSWNGATYNCNPRVIAEKLIEDEKGKWNVYYAFIEPHKFNNIIKQGIQTCELGSLKYFYILATCKFIIANTRFAGCLWPYKKNGQKYIQTMHGGHGLKRVETDVELPESYLEAAEEDARRTDLMLSDSTFWTKLARTAFLYPEGDLLEGLPRNDIFFESETVKDKLRRKVRLKLFGKENADFKCLIYTPTFRNNGRRDVYGFDIEKITRALTERFKGDWKILISSHPNMKGYYRDIYDFSDKRIIDVGDYYDLQELLIISDVCITDYSSAGMEFSLQNKPTFLLCRDKEDYDRGYYFDLEKLPYPYAENEEELIQNILSFDNEKYLNELESFNRDVIGLNETGHATEAVIEWMEKNI